MKKYFERNPRIAGLFLVTISLILGKFYMWDVVVAAQAHADNVSVSMKLVLFSIMFFLFGIFLSITGPFGDQMMRAAPGSRKLSLIGWIAVIIVCAVSFAGYFAFQHYIESFGYKF
ncbi:MAG: hypothetical protein JST89_01685 [Cyanobacteria bacterium SZAS-4]|nr:hypothetical protein [Cyanobacteria bacterium SZAS-4]